MTNTKNAIKKSLSVIIPALNEEDFIENLLNDIIQQTGYDEVIVVDSGSTDKTREKVENFKKKHPEQNIKLVHAPVKGHGIARNYGAKKSAKDYIVFLDAATRIPKNFFHNILQETVERKLNMAGCYVKADSTKTIDQIIFFLQNFLILKPLQYTKHPGGNGSGIITEKKFHEAISGFDEKIQLGEDLDYIRKGSTHGLFRMLKSTYILVSVRRFEKEGRFKVWSKYCVSGIHYLLNIKSSEIKYEFGKFNKTSQDKQN